MHKITETSRVHTYLSRQKQKGEVSVRTYEDTYHMLNESQHVNPSTRRCPYSTIFYKKLKNVSCEYDSLNG